MYNITPYIRYTAAVKKAEAFDLVMITLNMFVEEILAILFTFVVFENKLAIISFFVFGETVISMYMAIFNSLNAIPQILHSADWTYMRSLPHGILSTQIRFNIDVACLISSLANLAAFIILRLCFTQAAAAQTVFIVVLAPVTVLVLASISVLLSTLVFVWPSRASPMGIIYTFFPFFNYNPEFMRPRSSFISKLLLVFSFPVFFSLRFPEPKAWIAAVCLVGSAALFYACVLVFERAAARVSGYSYS